MEIKSIDADFTVCKVTDFSEVDFEAEYCFTAKTDEENSVVCQTKDAPKNTMAGISHRRHIGFFARRHTGANFIAACGGANRNIRGFHIQHGLHICKKGKRIRGTQQIAKCSVKYALVRKQLWTNEKKYGKIIIYLFICERKR